MTCQMLFTNRVPYKGKAVVKRALLVTERIPDKKGLPSQVYRAPGAIFLMAPDSAFSIERGHIPYGS